jgi:hypothetical protein
MNNALHLLLSGLAMSTLVNAHAPLTGQWGGDRANLTIDAKGGQIEMDCAHGSFAAPLTLDKAGRFTGKGVLVSHRPGPSRIDVPDPHHTAIYSGKLTGSTLMLSIKVTGDATPQQFRLVKDARVKLHRCL